MDVSGVGSVGGAASTRPLDVQSVQPTGSAARGVELPQDEVHISPAARLLEQASADPAVRAERLQQVQAAIADGTYETPQKLEAAITKLLAELDSRTE